MKRAKAVIFVVGLVLVAVSGYLPWHYAAQYETLRVDFSPTFPSKFCTPLGLLLTSISIATWVGGVAVVPYLIY